MPKKLQLKKFRAFETRAVSRRKTLTSTGQRLQSRRLFALLYGNISNSQYQRLAREAQKYTGKVGVRFLSLVERRLDVVVQRMFLFPTLQSARQFISHKGVLVNNRILNCSSSALHPGDIIQIKSPQDFFAQYSLDSGSYANLSLQKNLVLYPHLETNYKNLTGVFLFSPHQIYYRIPKLVCTEAGIALQDRKSES